MLLTVMIAAGIILILSDKSESGSLSSWLKPVTGTITSQYGNRTRNGKIEFHNGIDIAVPVGTPVLSPADGEVISIYSNSRGGNQLIVSHANGYQSGYAHLNQYNVRVGQKVTRGQKIAWSGNTGTSTGPHLHFTVRKNGTPVNPSTVLPK